MSVDQRLTVFEDGAVELDERHRSRDPTWLRLDAAEFDRLRSALEEMPERRWSILPKLALIRVTSAVTLSLSLNQFETRGTHFELKRGRRVIAGESPPDFDVAAVVTLLDALRVHAVRLHPR